MAGLTLLASSRPTFNAGGKTLTFERPNVAVKGTLMLIVAGYDPADGFVLSDGWTTLAAYVGTSAIALLARMVDDNEPSEIVLAITSAAKDWLGQLLVYDAGSPNVVLEVGAHGNFAADATPPTPAAACQQAIDVELRVWSTAAALALTAPAGMTTIDSYSSAIATARSLLVAQMIAGATGNLSAKDATAGAAATGTGATFVLRDRPPVTPAVLFDPVPGNIGLVGKDERPPRSAL